MVILHGLMYILHYSSSLILMMKSEKRKQNYCLLLALTNSAPISDERMTLIPGAGRFEVTTSTGSSHLGHRGLGCLLVAVQRLFV